MQAFGQAGAAPAAWARIQLVRGQSNGAVWQIDSQYPQARLSIGSDPGAGWPVTAFGVLPSHFEIYWDGRCLYIADSLRVGGVTLNGAPLGQEWVQIRGRGDVTFGQAAMTIETSDQAVQPIQTDPSIARRISLTGGEPGTSEIVNEATRVAEPSWAGVESLDGESTRIGEEGMIPGKAGAPSFGAAAGRPVMGAPPKAPSQAPPPPPGFRPRLGGQPGGLREPAPTLTGGPLLPPQEATRMVALDDVPPSVVVAPGMGASGMGAPPPSFGAPGFGGPNGPPSGSAFSPTAPPDAPPGGGFAMPSGPAGGFAAPPAVPPNQNRQALRNAVNKVPPRTLVLIAVTLVAALAALLMFMPGGEPDPPPPGPLAPPYVPAAVVPAVPGVPPVPVVPSTPTTPIPAIPTAPIPPIAPAPIPPTPTAPIPPIPTAPIPPTPTVIPTAPIPPTPTVIPPAPIPPTPTVIPTAPTPPTPTALPPVPVDPNLGPTDDRRAADLAIAGRFAEALPIYQALALAHPDRPEYGMMVRVLERRIMAASCLNGLTPDGRPCTTEGF